jgi:hypothetical protein
MRDAPDPEQNTAAAVGTGVPWRVVEVRVLADQRLDVRFIDGTHGTVDLSELIQAPNAGVFERLRDPELFGQVGIESGAVTWPGELDLAPDAMYDAIKATGNWRPQ